MLTKLHLERKWKINPRVLFCLLFQSTAEKNHISRLISEPIKKCTWLLVFACRTEEAVFLEVLSKIFEGMSLIRKNKIGFILVLFGQCQAKIFGTKIQEKINFFRMSYHCQTLGWKTVWGVRASYQDSQFVRNSVSKHRIICLFVWRVEGWSRRPRFAYCQREINLAGISEGHSHSFFRIMSGRDLFKLSKVLTPTQLGIVDPLVRAWSIHITASVCFASIICTCCFFQAHPWVTGAFCTGVESSAFWKFVAPWGGYSRWL